MILSIRMLWSEVLGTQTCIARIRWVLRHPSGSHIVHQQLAMFLPMSL